MTRFLTLRRVLPMMLLLALTATVASAQSVLMGSFTLQREVRWGQLTLEPGDYTFKIERDTTAQNVVSLRQHDGKVVGYVLAAARDENNSRDSYLLLSKTGDTYAVRELRVADTLAFTYGVPRVRSMQRLAQSDEPTVVAVHTVGKK